MSYQLPLFEITSCKCNVMFSFRLENEIVRLREEKDIEVSLKNTRKRKNPKKCWSNMFKNSQIYIVLTPEFEGYFNGKSLPAYGRMGKVRIEMKKKNEKLNYWIYFFILFSGFPDWWSWFWHLLEASTRVRDKQLPLKISESAFSCDVCCWWDNSKSLW